MKAYRILLQITLTIAAAGFASAAAAAMYKWIDADGNVQYSETAPEGANVKEIAPPPRVNPTPAIDTAPPATDTSKQADNAGSKGEKENGQEAPLTPEEQETYKRNCEAARANLEIYKTSGRIRQADGEVVGINDELRQKKIQQAEEQIKKFCK